MSSRLQTFIGILLSMLSFYASAQLPGVLANAGIDQNVEPGEIVTLDGSGSFDPSGVGLSYLWEQVGGQPIVRLSSPASPHPVFTAPAEPTVLTFRLTVNNRSQQASDTVDIVIQTENTLPAADAGVDFPVRAGATVQLDGTGSYDPDGDPIIYQWTQLSGPSVNLINSDTPTPSFTAPLENTILEFQLVLADGFILGEPDTVLVTVAENTPPIADAGQDITANEYSPVTLDGTGSIDQEGDGLNYQWTQVSGTPVTLQFADTATPVFTAPGVNSGTQDLEFQLVVVDQYPFAPATSAPDSVIVHVLDVAAAPNCAMALPDISSLWPPNHKMQEVSITGLSDPDDIDSTLMIQILGVTQDEPVITDNDTDGKRRSKDKSDKHDKKDKKDKSDKHDKKDKKDKSDKHDKKDKKDKSDKHDKKDKKDKYWNTSPDAVIIDNAGIDTALLRAERAGRGNGRVYQVSFEASNAAGACSGSVRVEVPHDRSHPVIDDGQEYDSTTD